MKEDSEENKSCLVLIVGIVITILISNLLFWIINKIQDCAAITIVAVISIVLIVFIAMCVAGMKK